MWGVAVLVIPAIDLQDGRCVRLKQGRLTEATVYSDRPDEMARQWADQGAPWLHCVDLDGAVAGEPKNMAMIIKIMMAVSVPIEVGGGVRTLGAIERYLSLGASRVVVGTAVLQDADLVRAACGRFPGRIVAAVDARDGQVAVRGWTETTGVEAVEFASRVADLGVTVILYTAIGRDGMLAGPDLPGTRAIVEAVAGATGSPGRTAVIASGGVRGIEDLVALQGTGVWGAVVGRALYEGQLDLKAAMTAVGA